VAAAARRRPVVERQGRRATETLGRELLSNRDVEQESR
jgi:hypothetical protein